MRKNQLSHLYKDATGLEEQINLWATDVTYAQGAQAIVEALSSQDLYQHPVFMDEHYPEFALLALQKDLISMAQFSSIILFWSAQKDFKPHGYSIDQYVLPTTTTPSSEATHQFRRFMKILDLLYPVKMNDEDFNAIIEKLSTQPESERCFHTLYFEDESDLPEIYFALKQTGFSLFMPQKTTGGVTLLIPSFSMIQAVLDAIKPDEIKLVPVIGETSAEGVLELHSNKCHPFGISFPGFEHDIADNFVANRYGFSLHDIYHALLLAHVPVRNAIHKITELAKEFIGVNALGENSVIAQRLGMLIDQKFAQYYHIAVSEKMGVDISKTPFANAATKEACFVQCLIRLFLPKDFETQQEAALDTPPQDIQHEFVRYILTHMISNKSTWLEAFDIDVDKLLQEICINQTPLQLFQSVHPNAGALQNMPLVKLTKRMYEHLKTTTSGLLEEISYDLLPTKEQQTPPNDDFQDDTNETLDALLEAIKENDLIKAAELLIDIDLTEPRVALSGPMNIKLSSTWGLIRQRPISIDMRKLCIKHGANINEPSLDGIPELVYAAKIGDVDYVKHLVECGVDVNVRDESSLKFKTPLDHAAKGEHNEIKDFLIENGAIKSTHKPRLNLVRFVKPEPTPAVAEKEPTIYSPERKQKRQNIGFFNIADQCLEYESRAATQKFNGMIDEVFLQCKSTNNFQKTVQAFKSLKTLSPQSILLKLQTLSIETQSMMIYIPQYMGTLFQIDESECPEHFCRQTIGFLKHSQNDMTHVMQTLKKAIGLFDAKAVQRGYEKLFADLKQLADDLNGCDDPKAIINEAFEKIFIQQMQVTQDYITTLVPCEEYKDLTDFTIKSSEFMAAHGHNIIMDQHLQSKLIRLQIVFSISQAKFVDILEEGYINVMPIFSHTMSCFNTVTEETIEEENISKAANKLSEALSKSFATQKLMLTQQICQAFMSAPHLFFDVLFEFNPNPMENNLLEKIVNIILENHYDKQHFIEIAKDYSESEEPHADDVKMVLSTLHHDTIEYN